VSIPDAVYVNGSIVTVDDRFSIAEAFAVSNGRFVSVGSNAQIGAIAGSATQVIDLAGRTVLPGFIDTHAHTVFRGVAALAGPSLMGARSVAAIIGRIRETARTTPAGEWISTSPIGDPPDYFDLPEQLEGGVWPSRYDLDAAAPDHLVYVPTPVYWPHPAIFNTRALAALGVTRQTPDESGVRIIRDPESGEPTGVIYGLHLYNRTSSFFGRLARMLPTASAEARQQAIRNAMQDNLPVGLTTIYEGHANFSTPDLVALHSAGLLPIRVVFTEEAPTRLPLDELDHWMGAQAAASGQGAGDDVLKMVGITVSLDGAVQFGGAHMTEPYLDPYGDPGNGRSWLSPERLADVARLAIAHDLRLNLLAAGSAAGAIAVEALETVHAETPLNGRDWLVQHFQHPDRSQIARLKAMGLSAQTYSSVDYSKGAEVYVKRFSTEVWRDVVPLRWWFDSGINIAHGSDGAHYDPMFQLWESLQRIDGRTGRSLLTPAKAITRHEAIRLQTINGARLLQWSDRLGSIETGKLADFVVLDRAILDCPVDEIRETKCLLTALGGDVVHGEL